MTSFSDFSCKGNSLLSKVYWKLLWIAFVDSMNVFSSFFFFFFQRKNDLKSSEHSAAPVLAILTAFRRICFWNQKKNYAHACIHICSIRNRCRLWSAISIFLVLKFLHKGEEIAFLLGKNNVRFRLYVTEMFWLKEELFSEHASI